MKVTPHSTAGQVMNRRSLGHSILGAASLALSSQTSRPGGSGRSSGPLWAPGIKIGTRLVPDPTEEDLSFFSRLGIRYATIWTGMENARREYFRSMKEKLKEHGITVWNIGILDLHCDPTIVLGLPDMNSRIQQYCQYLQDLGSCGISYTTYAHMANIKMREYFQTGTARTRGNVQTRVFAAEEASRLPLSHGRVYSEEEIWETFTHFIRSVMPAAEKAGVRIGLHPDDPPLPSLGGVARIFRDFRSLERALEIANSDHFGVCLCVGTWAEGGDSMGLDVYETLRKLGLAGKLFKVHMRNVSAPLPRFEETFIDDGYIDMCRVMAILHSVEFRGVVIPDHVPGEGLRGENTSYTIGYLKGLRDLVSR